MVEGFGFTVDISEENMPDMRSKMPSTQLKKKKPKMVQASFQAGEP